MIIRHFKIWVITLSAILAALVLISAVVLFTGSCAYRNNCLEGGRGRLVHTPIPTLIPAVQPAFAFISVPSDSQTCTTDAQDLLSAWVQGGASESEPFQFSDLNNISCQGTFTDVVPLFSQTSLWFPGALACTDCHNSALAASNSAGLDLSSFVGITAGSGRSTGTASGKDILGAGDWKGSILNQVLFQDHSMPFGVPPGAVTDGGPVIQAGLPLSVVNATPEPTPSEVEVARPNTPGGTGEAVNLIGDPKAGEQIFVDHCLLCHGPQGTDSVLNPGSDDGTVPALNPLDETLISADHATYIYNLDLFLENGSRPAGINPARLMPPWGAKNGLTQQQIADVMEYIISLNK